MPPPDGPGSQRPAQAGWEDDAGLATLPSGIMVRGRRIADAVSPADFALLLAAGPAPAWASRRVCWPDFGVPANDQEALDALHEAYRRARDGQRVEVACRGGVGRTGTALAALAIIDGLTPAEAFRWVRASYHPRAVETIWQRRWLSKVSPAR